MKRVRLGQRRRRWANSESTLGKRFVFAGYRHKRKPDVRTVLHFIGRFRGLLGPAYGRYPSKFILPEFVSYLGGRGGLCVRNG